jgi:hypothetical protein
MRSIGRRCYESEARFTGKRSEVEIRFDGEGVHGLSALLVNRRERDIVAIGRQARLFAEFASRGASWQSGSAAALYRRTFRPALAK